MSPSALYQPDRDRNSILVLGGTGRLGNAIITALARHPSRPNQSHNHNHNTSIISSRIAVLLRSVPGFSSSFSSPSASSSVSSSALSSSASSSTIRAQQLADLSALHVEIVEGDIENDSHEQLVRVFSGFGTVVSCYGMTGSKGVQMKIARAVCEAEVERFVPWQFGVDYDTIGKGSAQDKFDEQLDVRSFLRGQTSTEWLIFSTGLFMDFCFDGAFGIVDSKRGAVRAFEGWEGKVTATRVEDIGRVVAGVVWGDGDDGGEVWRTGEGSGVQGRIVWVAGDTFSYSELLEAVEEATGRKWAREVWKLEDLKRDLREDPRNDVKKYRVVWGTGKGVSWEVGRSYNGLRGMGMMGVREFARLTLS